ncbi:MAG TPA: alpha/beta hydrolase [Dehalococcoidia bacterium]|nr:alpha/beta hydrolase [Dehalococcoidia bacterium]
MTTATGIDQMVQVGDATLHLLRGGGGRPALVLHGIEGPEGWLAFHEALSRQADVIAPSHPGFGLSERPEWMESIGHQALFYEWFLRERGIDEVDLIGFGIGGWIAAEMAAMNSENLRRLVLIDAAGVRPVEGETVDIFVQPWRDIVAACVHNPEGAEEYRRIYDELPIVDFGGAREAGRSMTMRLCYRPYMHNPAFPAALGAVRTPTLVVWGSDDRIIPVECGRLYAGAIPGARIEVIEGCGHWPHYEKPAELAEVVAKFLGA